MFYKVYLNENLVKTSTEKAVLFEIENHATFGCISFWFPKRLLNFVKCSTPFLTLTIPDTFVFTITNHTTNESGVISSQAEQFSASDFVYLMEDYNNEIKKIAHIS